MTAAALSVSLIPDLDRLLDGFRAGDVVTVREHVELCEVLELHDPRTGGERFAGVCTPGVLVCRIDGVGGALLVEPRDLSLVDRPSGR